MIMTTFFLFTLLTLFMKEFNPMKISFIIFSSSILSFFLMKMSLMNSFFPIIFSLLFSGGILIMFMMLCSLMPNMEMPKNMSFALLFFFFTYVIFFKSENMINAMFFVSYFMYFSFSFLILMILLYFFCFIFLLSKDSNSLRSFFC